MATRLRKEYNFFLNFISAHVYKYCTICELDVNLIGGWAT